MSKKFVPHDYQVRAIEKLVSENAVGLFLDMGLGKTAIVLSAIMVLKYQNFSVINVLVIAPKKVAESTWMQEAAKWEHTARLNVVYIGGTATQRVAALNRKASVYVISRDNLVWLVKHLKADWGFDMVVIDELSSFKNHQAKRFKALCWVRKYIKRIVGLTGTPSPQGLIDLWSQIFLLDGGERLGKTIGGYRSRYFVPDQGDGYIVYSYKPKADAEKVIHEKISDLCISMKAEDYLSLPECLYVDVQIILEGRAKKAYEELETDMVLTYGEMVVDASTAAVLSNKLLQLCNGAVYDTERKVVEIHQAKLDALAELVESLNGASAIVFYNYQHDLSRIGAMLEGSGLRVRLLKTPQDEVDWNTGKIDILLAHPASAAYGLNLQDGGHHIIWFGLNWNLELYLQANKRLHRQGQTKTVIIHRLIVKGGLDEDVAKALETKGNTQERLMVALKDRVIRVCASNE
jgi:SNF2 family DNA or RNA helicase